MKKDSLLVRIFRFAAIENFLATLPAFFMYDFYVGFFLDIPPHYKFLVWIWSGMAFLWGLMFWEISTNVRQKYDMIRYAYLEKAITSVSGTLAFWVGVVPLRFFIALIFTDAIWVPIFIYAQKKAK